MNDEKFVYFQDIREKNAAARSAHNRRAGKRGAVKLQSDNLTRKELSKMSGDVKAYRLNEPMTWTEFKAMPDDIQTSYIKNLRDKFNVPAYKIAEMFGVSAWTMSAVNKRLSIVFPKGISPDFDADAWSAWCGEKEEIAAEQADTAQIEQAAAGEPWAVPCAGSMTIAGTVDSVSNTLRRILGGAHVRLSIVWEVLGDDRNPSK